MTSYNNVIKLREREFLIECIELYKELPALWKIKSKIYHDREKKSEAYEILLAKYNEMYPQATKEDLKKKINSLRTNYRKELKKQVNSMQYGAGAESIYLPTLWYFEAMNFLKNEELPLDTTTSMDGIHKIEKADEDEDYYEEERLDIRVCKDEVQDSTPSETPPRKMPRYAPQKAKKRAKLIHLGYERSITVKDECHHWAMACAADLQKMEKTQQIFAKKAIAEIIMEGQLGLLHRHSVNINENPLKTSVRFAASLSPQYSNCSASP